MIGMKVVVYNVKMLRKVPGKTLCLDDKLFMSEKKAISYIQKTIESILKKHANDPEYISEIPNADDITPGKEITYRFHWFDDNESIVYFERELL